MSNKTHFIYYSLIVIGFFQCRDNEVSPCQNDVSVYSLHSYQSRPDIDDCYAKGLKVIPCYNEVEFKSNAYYFKSKGKIAIVFMNYTHIYPWAEDLRDFAAEEMGIEFDKLELGTKRIYPLADSITNNTNLAIGSFVLSEDDGDVHSGSYKIDESKKNIINISKIDNFSSIIEGTFEINYMLENQIAGRKDLANLVSFKQGVFKARELK